MRRLHISLLLLLTCATLAWGRSHYATVYNHFGSLAPSLATLPEHTSSHIDDNLLVIANSSQSPLLLADTTLAAAGSYEYLVRVASLNNKAGHSYKVTDAHGNTRRVSTTTWGIVFDYVDQTHYMCAEVTCHNSDPYDDLTNKSHMQVAVYRHDGNNNELVTMAQVDDGVDMDDNFNTLSVKVNRDQATLYIGKKKLQAVAAVQLSADEARVIQTGLWLGPGAKVAVERTVLTSQSNRPRRLATTWTVEALDQHFATSNDPLEGYWQYQDRDIEDKWLRMGGRYTVAVVAANGGYDIVYIDGAQVNAAQWHKGLLKGHISKTIFDGHYDLEWIDATFEPIVQDAYATFDSSVLMTLNFPVYRSQVRMSKVLK